MENDKKVGAFFRSHLSETLPSLLHDLIFFLTFWIDRKLSCCEILAPTPNSNNECAELLAGVENCGRRTVGQTSGI